MYLKIGIGEADITPPEGITGRIGLNHSLEVKHPIFARALVLKTAKDIITQVTCELVGHTTGTMNRIYSKIEKELGLDRNNIILTCTHTHSSPWIWDLQSKEAERFGINLLDWDWLDKIVDGCVKSIRFAIENIQPSILRIGSSKVKNVASNRVEVGARSSICKDDSLRNKPVGQIDPEVRVLSIYGLKNKLRALFVNYACHPSAYGGGKTKFVSPDFPYYASEFISSHFGRHIPMSYWMGCAGDINVGKFNACGSEEEVQRFGKRLADGILKSLDSSKEIKVKDDDIILLTKDLELSVGDWVEPIEEARVKFNNISNQVVNYLKKGDPIPLNLVNQWRMALKRLDVCLLSNSDKMKVRIYLWKLGNLFLVFVPGEWFVRYGLEMAKLSPKRHIWITTLTNIDLLYIPDREAMIHREWYGVNPVMRTISDESVDVLVGTVRNMIKQNE